MRWAQGWFQVSRKHLIPAMKSKSLTRRQKAGMFHLLGWREFIRGSRCRCGRLSGSGSGRMAASPDQLAGSDFRADYGVHLERGSGAGAFFLPVGRAPDSGTPAVVLWYLVTAPVYTELKNVISRVAQIKELMGERQWKVTPRGVDDPFEFGDEEFGGEADVAAATTAAIEVISSLVSLDLRILDVVRGRSRGPCCCGRAGVGVVRRCVDLRRDRTFCFGFGAVCADGRYVCG